MLKCKKCGHSYVKDQIYCDQCGNNLPPRDDEEIINEWMSCPTCKRKINKSISICPFCGENINLNQIIENVIIKNKSKNYAILGFIFGVISIISFLFFPLVSLSMGIVGLVLSIIGLRINKTIGISGIISSVLGLSITIILLVLVVGFNYSNNLISWSIQQNDVLENLSGNTKYKFTVYTTWEHIEEKDLLILRSDGTYEWYQDKNNLDNNYEKGVFILENGVNLYNDMLYEDANYYYYQLTLVRLNVSSNHQSSSRNLTQITYTLGISKVERNNMCLEDIETGEKMYFRKLNTNNIS